jgi:ABC-type hemin transport system substrate-binding protein
MELVIGQRSVIVDGIAAEADAAPVIIEDRIFLPLRVLIERIGGSVSWKAATRQVTVKARGTIIVLTIGKSTALVNGASTAIDPANAKVVPTIVGGRTLLPLRFVAESLGLDITWNSGLRTAIVTWEP